MYIYLFDKRSMAVFGAVSLASALLLFTGGVLLGLYFDLPAAGGPARASLGAESEAAVEKALAGRTDKPAATPPAAPPEARGSAAPSGEAEPPGGESTGDQTPAAGAEPAGAEPAPPPDPDPEPAPALSPAPLPPPAVPTSRPVPAAQPVLAAAPETAPAYPTPLAATTPNPGTAFTVQIGAYSVEDNARREVASLEAAGYQPYVMTVTGSAGRPLHTVLLGAYGDRREADSEAARFATRQGRKVWVRPLGPP